jgi:hypothetical protein
MEIEHEGEEAGHDDKDVGRAVHVGYGDGG